MWKSWRFAAMALAAVILAGCGGRDAPKTPAVDAQAEIALDTVVTAAEARNEPASAADTTETDNDTDVGNILIKDLDGDNTPDTVYYDKETAEIVCVLSNFNFSKIKSEPVGGDGDVTSIFDTKNGFGLRVSFMRAGYSNQFRYETKLGKIRLIGMSRYESGNAANDGSGESSVNLLTGDYIGNWNYYDDEKDTLISIPTIKTKMTFPPIYLEDFNDEIYFEDYGSKCAEIYNRHKKLHQQKNNGGQK